VPNVPGHLNDPVVDGSDQLGERMFWPAHLLQCTGGDPDDLCTAFGVDEDALWAFYYRLTDEGQWPVFHIALPSGHVLYVVYRNFAEDAGYDYLLHHPDSAEPIMLATVEGHYLGPALCWSELVAVSQAPAGAAATRAPERRIGILLPVMADDDLPEDAVDVLAGALHTLGAGRQPGRLAQRLLDKQGMWGPQPWRMVDGVPISMAPRYATRTPEVLPNAVLAQIAEALAGTSRAS
jgi:hypothetical protein